ncbi:hypothetical protein [Rhizorhabdus wittichii]
MGDIATLGRKLERAMRNQTGFNVTLDEIAALKQCSARFRKRD